MTSSGAITSQNIVLLQVRRNAEAFDSLIAALLKLLGRSGSCLILVQKRHLLNLELLTQQVRQKHLATLF